MHKYMLATLVAFALVLSSCSDSSQPTSAQQQRMGMEQKSTSTWQDFNSTIYNPCCNTYITLTGKYHLVSNGDFSRAKVNLAQLVGVDENGNTYHGNAGAHQVIYEDGTYKYTEHWSLSSPDGCSFELTVKYHSEIDENGNYVFITDEYEFDCK